MDRPLRVLHVDDVPVYRLIVQDILTNFGHTGVVAPPALRRWNT